MSPPPLRRIGISLGNIGALHDGLGEFALQIGQRVAAAAPLWRERDGVALAFHLRAKFSGLFGDQVQYLPVSRWHRLRHVQPEPYALWHSLHQVNKNRAPTSCGPGGGVRVQTVHDLNYLYGPQDFAAWRQHRRAQAMARRTDVMTAISHHTAQDVRQHLGWADEITVIPNGARSLVGAEQVPLPGWPAEGAKPFLFHLSRMSASKNPQALVALARAWPDMDFVFCGPPSDEAQHLRATVQLPNLQFHLGISDAQKAWAYAHCAGFLFPSLTEGFGLPPIEAMHFGKPVFLSRLTSLPEVGGRAADYFDSFDPDTMKAVVQQGLDRAQAPGHAEAVRQHAAQFNWDRAAKAYLALYRRLLQLPAEPTQDQPAERAPG
jgi:glycosyltransferase involved in cell wall biosynthesis